MNVGRRFQVGLLAGLLTLAAVAQAGASGVHLSFGSSAITVAPGEIFTVPLTVFQADDAFNAFDAYPHFDPAFLSFVPTVPVNNQRGPLMTGACANIFSRFVADPDSLEINLSLLCSGVSVTGPGVIYLVKFQAGTTLGTTTLSFGPGTAFYNSGSFITPPLETQNLTVTIACPAISVNPPTLPAGTQNVAYNQTLSGVGGTGPYNFAVTSGSLPSGLTLTSAGVLSGTPTLPGSSNFTVTATDAHNCTGSTAYTLVIACPTISLSPSSLPAATEGVAYSASLSASGGTGPYSFAVTVGSLPPGLTLTSAGVLAGTPTTPGSYNFTATATDANGCTGTRAYSLTIACPAITLAPPSLPGAVVGSPYSQNLTASGGTGPYTFTVSAGSLPPGLGLAAGGTLSGTPTSAGTFNFTAKATDANGCTGTLAYSLVVTCPAISVSPGTLPGGTQGSAYSQTINASGGTAPYTFAVSAGALPTGLTLTSAGVLGGTPTIPGTYNFTVMATDANGCTGSRSYSVTIACPLITLAPGTLPAGTVKLDYAQTLTASGGTGPYSFSVTAGSLPAGLTLSSGGVLGGTAVTAGSSTFTVTATDVHGCSGSQSYTLVINCLTVTISPGTLPGGTQGIGYSQTLSGSGGTVPYSFSVSAGSVPPGLTLTGAGVLSGTPTLPGSYSFTVSVVEANGCTGSQAYTVAIACPAIALAPASLPGGTQGIAYSQTLTASGGTAPYTFAVSAGALPNGLTLTSAGLLSGTPTTPGSYNFTLTVTDAHGCTGSLSHTVVIGCPTIAIAPPALPGGTQGIGYSQTVTASGGTAPYTFTVSAGAVPAGLTLTSAGVLSGTPTTPGTYNFTVTATDAHGCTGSLSYTVVIGCPTIAIAPPALPGGTQGIGYSQTVTASGGTAPYTFTVSAGSLPPSLTLTSAGVLSGTPTIPGPYNFTVTATDANGCTGSLSYTVAIACPPITLAPATLLPGAQGSAYGATITASGGTAPYAFTVSAGALPSGLSLALDGTLSGAPTLEGSYNFTVTASDAHGCIGSLAYTLAISCPTITIAPATLPGGTIGVAYSQPLGASGGGGTFTFAASGTLPTGLSLSAAGVLSGTPSATGSFTFTVTATDEKGCSGLKSYTVSIACPLIALAPATLPGGILTVPYNQSLTAIGGASPYSFVVTSGALPPGLGLASDGTISGTPTAGGTYSFSVRATDANGCSGDRSYTLTVSVTGAVGDWATPHVFMLRAPSPNPARGRAVGHFVFGLPSAAAVKFELFDARGRTVGSRRAEWFSAGWHSIDWNARDLGSGTYFVRLTTHSGSAVTGRWVVVK